MAKRTPQTANCRRCRALITNPRYVAEGVTPYCKRKEAEEAAQREADRERGIVFAVASVELVATFKDPRKAFDKAVQLLLDEALIPTRHAGQYLAKSSSGEDTYLVDTFERSCTCPAFAHHQRCSHLVAAYAADLLNTTHDLAA